MSKPMGIREACRKARDNAAALIEAMDLEQLFGGDDEVEGNEQVFTQAQEMVVKFLRVYNQGAAVTQPTQRRAQ